ncbi:hypothetical protein TWF694_009674 [Orbilia ellipsospora]|uniref:Uncharacterized protein n=1 Tax=Orbilia ellipsospora TaxID=2528407 RepID=A0AAV9XBJ1_9PEZI
MMRVDTRLKKLRMPRQPNQLQSHIDGKFRRQLQASSDENFSSFSVSRDIEFETSRIVALNFLSCLEQSGFEFADNRRRSFATLNPECRGETQLQFDAKYSPARPHQILSHDDDDGRLCQHYIFH